MKKLIIAAAISLLPVLSYAANDDISDRPELGTATSADSLLGVDDSASAGSRLRRILFASSGDFVLAGNGTWWSKSDLKTYVGTNIDFLAADLAGYQIKDTTAPVVGRNFVLDTLSPGDADDTLHVWSIDKLGSQLATKANVKADTNVIEWHFDSAKLGASATVPDEAMSFRIPVGVAYGNLYVSCDGTTHTNLALDIAYSSTRGGTYTDEGSPITATFTHGSTAESAIDVSSFGSLTAGQYINMRVSTASTGDATYCDASLILTNN